MNECITFITIVSVYIMSWSFFSAFFYNYSCCCCCHCYWGHTRAAAVDVIPHDDGDDDEHDDDDDDYVDDGMTLKYSMNIHSPFVVVKQLKINSKF